MDGILKSWHPKVDFKYTMSLGKFIRSLFFRQPFVYWEMIFVSLPHNCRDIFKYTDRITIWCIIRNYTFDYKTEDRPNKVKNTLLLEVPVNKRIFIETGIYCKQWNFPKMDLSSWRKPIFIAIVTIFNNNETVGRGLVSRPVRWA